MVLLNVDELLLAPVLLVEKLRVRIMHKIVALGCDEDPWNLYMLHLVR